MHMVSHYGNQDAGLGGSLALLMFLTHYVPSKLSLKVQPYNRHVPTIFQSIFHLCSQNKTAFKKSHTHANIWKILFGADGKFIHLADASGIAFPELYYYRENLME